MNILQKSGNKLIYQKDGEAIENCIYNYKIDWTYDSDAALVGDPSLTIKVNDVEVFGGAIRLVELDIIIPNEIGVPVAGVSYDWTDIKPRLLQL